MQTPYHAFIDGADIDYPYEQGKVPVIVVERVSDVVADYLVVVAPDGEKYSAPEGLMYTMTVSPIVLPPERDSELERVRSWLRVESIWRVQTNRNFGQNGRVSYVEARDEDDARAWAEKMPVTVLNVRRAVPADAEEAMEL